MGKSMLEKCAAAMYADVTEMRLRDAPVASGSGALVPWDSQSPVLQKRYISHARAAINALMEPSEDMVKAGALAMSGAMNVNEPVSAVIIGQPKDVFVAMLRAVAKKVAAAVHVGARSGLNLED